MDNPRGNYTDGAGFGGGFEDYEPDEDLIAPEAPPSPVGQDERRMQVRAYNFWTSLLGDRSFPSIEDLDPDNLPDFGPFSVLLDFTSGIENPGISFLGEKLAQECGADVEITHLSDVPSRSLLSRITDHYMQILANQAPIGFEAEFLNLQSQTVLYRGILLPFSSDDDTIDFVYGVINWKELADPQTTARLLAEFDEAMQEQVRAEPKENFDGRSEPDPLEPTSREPATLEDWVEGPMANSRQPDSEVDEDGVLDLGAFIRNGIEAARSSRRPGPYFGMAGAGLMENDGAQALDPVELGGSAEFDGFAGLDEENMGLADWLVCARELAEEAVRGEDRTRHSLYAAIGRAYDFYLASCDHPADYAELLADCGIAPQARAPMTPVVKLVFGADYDKTRLAEYAAALGHAQRLGLARGELAGLLAESEGGLKALVATERRLRREESGKATKTPKSSEKLARKLRCIEVQPIDAIAPDGEEFALVLIRRMGDGSVAMLGEVREDKALLAKAARKLDS